MSDQFKFVQAQFFTLAGSGCVLAATTVTLTSFTQIDGTLLTMTDFGSIGFGTLEPGNGTSEEQICFTGVSQNANGTATLTGVKNVAFVSPYTQTSGTAMSHPGGAKFIISNTAGFYDQLISKNDDETITGTYTFTNPNYPRMDTQTPAPTDPQQLVTKAYADGLAIAGAPNASTSVQGLVQIATQAQVDAKTVAGSTGADLVPTLAQYRSTLLSDYVVDTGAADAYVITPVPAATAYTTGQIFSFKATNTNTTTSTLNVSALGVKTIKKASGNNLAAGEILNGQIVMVEYDGTNFQLLSDVAPDPATQPGVQAGTYVYAADSVGTDAYAITVTPAIAAYAAGQTFYFKAGTANTGDATLAVSGLSAQTIVKNQVSPLITGDIKSGQIVQVTYDGTNFQLMSPASNSDIFSSSSQTVVQTSGTGETTIYSFTLPGGSLGAANVMQVLMPYNISKPGGTSGSFTCTIRIKYGATTMGSTAFTTTNAGIITSYGLLSIFLAGNGTTSTQILNAFLANDAVWGQPSNPLITGTSAETSTADKTFTITMQIANGSGGNGVAQGYMYAASFLK